LCDDEAVDDWAPESGQLRELPSGVTYKQLDHWARLGHLRPEGGNGTGNPRLWTEHEVHVAEIISDLRRAGLELAAAARVARSFANGAQGVSLAPGLSLWRHEPAVTSPADSIP
jgi:hypothetical protein